MIRAINNKCLENGDDVLVDEEQFFEMAHTFDGIENQQGFDEEFLGNKGIAKDMRTHVADKKKAVKVAEKETAKQAKADEKAAGKETKRKEKAAEKAAEKATKPKKETKAKKPKKNAAEAEPDLITSLVNLATNIEAPNQLEEEDELDVRVFQFEEKEYLIDDNNTLYDNNTHAIVGRFDVDSKQIISV